MTTSYVGADWIHWKCDGPCPLPDGTPHQVLFLDGDIEEDDDPTTWPWGEAGSRTIIAYRILEGRL